MQAGKYEKAETAYQQWTKPPSDWKPRTALERQKQKLCIVPAHPHDKTNFPYHGPIATAPLEFQLALPEDACSYSGFESSRSCTPSGGERFHCAPRYRR